MSNKSSYGPNGGVGGHNASKEDRHKQVDVSAYGVWRVTRLDDQQKRKHNQKDIVC